MVHSSEGEYLSGGARWGREIALENNSSIEERQKGSPVLQHGVK